MPEKTPHKEAHNATVPGAEQRPKRILVFSLAYSPLWGGAELAVKEITDRIEPDRFSFEMITVRFDSVLPKKERIGNIIVHRVGPGKPSPTAEEMLRFPLYFSKVLYPVRAFFKAVSLQHAQRFDALWSIMTYAGFPAVLFKLFRCPRIPFLLTLQEGDSVEHMVGRWRIRLVWPLFKHVFKRATVVQTISSYLAQFAYDHGARAPIEIVPNGVDVSAFMRAYSREERATLKERLSMREGEKYLITTSRLVPKNAIDAVIQALPHLPYNVRFLILGEGPLRASLETLARTEGVAERVRFLGHVEHSDLPLYLQVCDIFIRPSRSEGMGSSFVEAMAAGIPVIATPVGGIVDIIEDYRTGLFVNVDDPESIAEKVSVLLKESTLREELIRNAKAMVVAKHDWNVVVDLMLSRVFAALFKKEKREWIIRPGAPVGRNRTQS